MLMVSRSVFIGTCLAGCLAVLTGCYWVQREATFANPAVAALPESDVATLDWSDCLATTFTAIGCRVSVQVREGSHQVELTPDSSEYSRAKLPPGTYHIEVYQIITDGQLKGYQTSVLSGQMALKQGRVYFVNKSMWTAQPRAWTTSWWIEEENSGELIAGSKPPEHLPGFSYHSLYK